MSIGSFFQNSTKLLNTPQNTKFDEILFERLIGGGIRADRCDTVELLDGIYTVLPSGELIKSVIYKPTLTYRNFKSAGFESFHIYYCTTLKRELHSNYKIVFTKENKFFVNVKQNRADVSIYRDLPLEICPECLMRYASLFNLAIEKEDFSLQKYSTASLAKRADPLFDIRPLDRNSPFFRDLTKIKQNLLWLRGNYCNECNMHVANSSFLMLHYENSENTGIKAPKFTLLCPNCHAKKQGHEQLRQDRIYTEFRNYRINLMSE